MILERNAFLLFAHIHTLFTFGHILCTNLLNQSMLCFVHIIKRETDAKRLLWSQHSMLYMDFYFIVIDLSPLIQLLTTIKLFPARPQPSIECSSSAKKKDNRNRFYQLKDTLFSNKHMLFAKTLLYRYITIVNAIYFSACVCV